MLNAFHQVVSPFCPSPPVFPEMPTDLFATVDDPEETAVPETAVPETDEYRLPEYSASHVKLSHMGRNEIHTADSLLFSIMVLHGVLSHYELTPEDQLIWDNTLRMYGDPRVDN